MLKGFKGSRGYYLIILIGALSVTAMICATIYLTASNNSEISNKSYREGYNDGYWDAYNITKFQY